LTKFSGQAPLTLVSLQQAQALVLALLLALLLLPVAHHYASWVLS
jgi:hypothetical protein